MNFTKGMHSVVLIPVDVSRTKVGVEPDTGPRITSRLMAVREKKLKGTPLDVKLIPFKATSTGTVAEDGEVPERTEQTTDEEETKVRAVVDAPNLHRLS